MLIRSVKHRGIRRFVWENDPREVHGDLVARVRNILSALIAARDMAGVQGPPRWRIHQLSGDRAGAWSLSVSGNWRITFWIVDGEIVDLNLEDYH